MTAVDWRKRGVDINATDGPKLGRKRLHIPLPYSTEGMEHVADGVEWLLKELREEVIPMPIHHGDKIAAMELRIEALDKWFKGLEAEWKEEMKKPGGQTDKLKVVEW